MIRFGIAAAAALPPLLLLLLLVSGTTNAGSVASPRGAGVNVTAALADCPHKFPFSCPSLPPAPPATHVRQLRAGNIKVVMTAGDSITAGFAMIGRPPADLREFRSYVYSIGAASDPDAETLFKMLRRYNSGVVGGATGWTWPLAKGGWLDGAVSMAKVQDVPSQIDYLVNELQTTYKEQVDFARDWKLLTLFIGANNICPSCTGSGSSKPAFFEAQLRGALERVKAKIPRVFVNLITIFDISGVWTAGQTSAYCRTLWEVDQHECYCLTTGKKADRDAMDQHTAVFNAIQHQVADDYAKLNLANFTVSVQPSLTGIDVAKYGLKYLSDLDCFHPSLCANQAFAYGIWNNMWEPAGNKTRHVDPNNLKWNCPTANSFIQ